MVQHGLYCLIHCYYMLTVPAFYIYPRADPPTVLIKNEIHFIDLFVVKLKNIFVIT